MNPMRLWPRYHGLCETAENVNLVLGSLDSEGEPSLRRVNLFAEPQDVFKVNADASVRQLAARRELVPYAPGYKPEPDEVLFVDLTAEPDVLAVVEAAGQLQRQEPYGGDENVVARGGFSATVIGAQRGKKAMFFSQFTPKNELARSRLTAIVQGRTGFDIVRERVLLFDADADCVAWSGYVFIRSVPAFERIFRFFEQARQRCRPSGCDHRAGDPHQQRRSIPGKLSEPTPDDCQDSLRWQETVS